MGTYTTTYNLFLPTIGEQGWGELVNGNFTTIDTTMAGLNTRLTAVENEVNGALSCTSVTTSGTITSTGKITANGGLAVTGGITSNLTGNVTGNVTGKIIISSVGTNSNNLKVCQMSCANVTGSFKHLSNQSTTMTLSSSNYTWAMYNTSIISYASGETALKNSCGTNTCTIKITNNSANSGVIPFAVVVTNTTDNQTILNTTIRVDDGASTGSTTFSRVYSKTYTVKISVGSVANPYDQRSHQFVCSVPTVTKYVP